MSTEMPIVGYSDRWSVRPGQTITFYVSTSSSQVEHSLVRLGHGQDAEGQGGPAALTIPGFEGRRAGQDQRILSGSSVRIEAMPGLRRFTFTAWIWPTLRSDREQCVAGRVSDVDAGGDWLLGIETGGRPFCSLGHEVIVSDSAVPLGQWSFVAFVVDDGEMRLEVRSPYFYTTADWSSSGKSILDAAPEPSLAPLIMGAGRLVAAGEGYRTEKPFNGKVSSPAIFDQPLDDADIGKLFNGDGSVFEKAYARWDFASDAGSDHVRDVTGHGLHGITRNRPGRLVSGHNFSGKSMDPSVVPEEFNAAYFHDDDLTDACWSPSFRITIPDDLPSAVYAAKVRNSEGDIDYLPFAVCPSAGKPSSKVAMLLPTLSYMVYGNEGFDTERLPKGVAPMRAAPINLAERAYCRANRLLSLYDFHSDGSGANIAGLRRPVPISFRPDFEGAATGSGHQLSADLQLLDWLEAVGIEYDVITDHELHTLGLAALAPYNAVLTGTHAEYWSESMLDGLQAYQNTGGRFVYLSGNGLYWVTALSDDGTLAEIRRPQGTRPWSGPPGESYISLSGELGGLWRHRGRPPQKLVGVGFSAQGWDTGKPFVRHEASYQPRVAFIFDGVDDAVIGDFPAIALEHGPAGFEFDRADYSLGTPPHALILATASGFSDAYQNSVEEVEATGSNFGGTTCSRVRADMVFFETPNNGAVFSGSSINFCCTLSYNKYKNNVSSILGNVVRTFAKDGPLPVGGDTR